MFIIEKVIFGYIGQNMWQKFGMCCTFDIKRVSGSERKSCGASCNSLSGKFVYHSTLLVFYKKQLQSKKDFNTDNNPPSMDDVQMALSAALNADDSNKVSLENLLVDNKEIKDTQKLT